MKHIFTVRGLLPENPAEGGSRGASSIIFIVRGVPTENYRPSFFIVRGVIAENY